MHTKDEEILALKAALKYTEFAAQDDCCPWCGGHGYHGQGCGIDALLRDEAAETFKTGTGGTVINDWIWMVNNDPRYAFLKPVLAVGDKKRETKTMCWLFHKWSKWSQYERPIVIYPGIIAPKEIRGKAIETVEQRQKRVCSVCGKAQDEVIYKDEQ